MDLELNALQERLDGISGLDVEAGLKTTAGRRESLARLLIKYASIHADDTLLLRQWMASGELESAQRLAHSLKGTAGFLGLSRVQGLATDLDAAYRVNSDQTEIERLLNALTRENETLCGAIKAAPSTTPVQAPRT